MIEKRIIENIKREKEILCSITHPFLIDLKWSFQNEDKIFFVMPFFEGGDLSMHLCLRGTLNEHEAKFYCVQIILALSCLHKNGMIYQDLKPANILMDRIGYIKPYKTCRFWCCQII